MLSLELITMLLVAIAMGLALAHALEHPGKMRLNRDDYLATQSIYYPGFTIGGFGEALSLPAALLLVLTSPRGAAPFWWSLAGFVFLAIMHAIYWMVTQPVNRYWAAVRKPAGAPLDQWERFRDRWEYSHIVRAICATAGLICITIAIALR
jgi:hypothetical protein